MTCGNIDREKVEAVKRELQDYRLRNNCMWCGESLKDHHSLDGHTPISVYEYCTALRMENTRLKAIVGKASGKEREGEPPTQ